MWEIFVLEGGGSSRALPAAYPTAQLFRSLNKSVALSMSYTRLVAAFNMHTSFRQK